MKTKPSENATMFPSGLTLDLASHDVDEMREQSLFWDLDIKQFSTGQFLGQVLASHTPRLQISRSSRSLGVTIQGTAPPETAVISFSLSPENELFYRGSLVQANQIMAFRDQEELELYSARPSGLITIVCGSHLLDTKARILTGKSFDQLRDQGLLCVNTCEYQQRTRRLLDLLQTLCYRSRHFSPTEEQLVEDEIIETALLGVTSCQVLPQKPARLVLAKKAERYIRDNLKKSLSISELCLVLGASERTLHLGFKERFGVSPKAYSLILRLNGTRQELARCHGNKTITDIAMEWDFFHLGRFSAQYKRLFAESPSCTRQQSVHP